MANQNTIDQITDTKCDYEFCVSAGREPKQYTAGVKVWEVAPDEWHLVGYWDMPGSIDNLGTPVTMHELATDIKSLPIGVMKEAQNFLFLGLEIMDEQGIRVTKRERVDVHGMVK